MRTTVSRLSVPIAAGRSTVVLLREGLVDEVSLLIHPSLVGGTSPKSMFRGADLESVDGVIPLRLTHLERLDNDCIWVVYEVVKPS